MIENEKKICENIWLIKSYHAFYLKIKIYHESLSLHYLVSFNNHASLKLLWPYVYILINYQLFDFLSLIIFLSLLKYIN